MLMHKNHLVDAWFEKTRNPQKILIAEVRDAVLSADARVGERLKWNSPTFTYHKELATFFPKTRSYACLLFHEGAEVPGHYPSFVLEDSGALTLRVRTAADLQSKYSELQALVRASCDLQERRPAP